MVLPRIQFALGLPRLPGQASFIMDYCHTCTTPRQPWPIKKLLTMKEEFVTLARQRQGSFGALCQRYGISRACGYTPVSSRIFIRLAYCSIPALSVVLPPGTATNPLKSWRRAFLYRT